MGTFRVIGDAYVPFQSTTIDDWEEKLEDDLEKNDHVLLWPERILYIGRQVTTDFNKAIDLLAIDSGRRPVIVELKKDRTPRMMVAQALEYTAFIHRQDYSSLNAIALKYFADRNHRIPTHPFPDWHSLAEAYSAFFEGIVAPDTGGDWNPSPSEIVILEGQTIAPEISDVARYLRTKNIDIRVLHFGYEEDVDHERIVRVQTVVGTEKTPEEVEQRSASLMPSMDEVLAQSDAAGVFEQLRTSLVSLNLFPRKLRTSLSLDLLPGRNPLMSLWPAPKEPRVYALIYRRRLPSSDVLDDFQNAAESLGFHTERETDLSVHVYPEQHDKVEQLIAEFERTILIPLRSARD